MSFETATHKAWQAARTRGKFCPDCGKKCKRVHHQYGPMDLDPRQMQTTPIIPPRVSDSDAWWNVGPIRWLIAPPDPPDPHLWYLLVLKISCPDCGIIEREEYRGVRQFGRARRLLFRIRDQIDKVLDIILPNH